MSFQLKPFKKRPARWTAAINGKDVTDSIRSARFTSQWGTLDFGLHPKDNSEMWSWDEAGGGGAITLPWLRTPHRRILVGLVLEDRPNISETPVFCAIGGFVDVGESHDIAQARESKEESGLDTKGAKRFPGARTNGNRLYFAGEGDVMYHLQIPFHLTERAGKDMRRLRDGTKHNFRKSAALWFLPWRTAVRQSPDAIAQSAIAKLLAELL